MANPQRENGHIEIANEIWDALAKIRISGEAVQVLNIILRNTYGWNLKEAFIPLSEFVERTGLPKNSICKAIKKLLAMNTITKKGNVTQKVNGKYYNPASYGFQKDYELWRPLPKKRTVKTVTQKVNKPYPKKRTKQGDTLIKDNLNTCVCTFFSYFVEKTGKTSKYKLTPERKKLIEKRLKDEYTLEEMKKAVDNFIQDDYEDRSKFMDLVYCIGIRRGVDNLEKWVNKKPKGIDRYGGKIL